MRPPFFINSGSISSGPAALLGFIFFIISLISSYVGSSSSKLFIGSSSVSILIILSASGFNNSLECCCHLSSIYFCSDSLLLSLSLHTNVVRVGRLDKFLTPL